MSSSKPEDVPTIIQTAVTRPELLDKTQNNPLEQPRQTLSAGDNPVLHTTSILNPPAFITPVLLGSQVKQTKYF